MDQLQTHLEALEQQMSTVNRRLHWWRGLACGLAVQAGLTWALPAVIAQEEADERGQKGLVHRVAPEQLLKHVSRDRKSSVRRIAIRSRIIGPGVRLVHDPIRGVEHAPRLQSCGRQTDQGARLIGRLSIHVVNLPCESP